MTIEHRTHRPYIAMGLDQQGRNPDRAPQPEDDEPREPMSTAEAVLLMAIYALSAWFVVAVLAKAAELVL